MHDILDAAAPEVRIIESRFDGHDHTLALDYSNILATGSRSVCSVGLASVRWIVAFLIFPRRGGPRR
jgi:hypothetical protein